MAGMTLRRPPRRADLRAFALVCGAFLGASVGAVVLVPLGGAPVEASTWALLTAGVIGVGGFLAPKSVRLGYRVWNKVARLLAQTLTSVVTWLTYALIVVPVSWFGGRLEVSSEERRPSQWDLRHGGVTRDVGRDEGAGLARLGRWALSNRNWWAVALLPTLGLLALLRDNTSVGDDLAVPNDVYTLY
jgi:hypothetical protein